MSATLSKIPAKIQSFNRHPPIQITQNPDFQSQIPEIQNPEWCEGRKCSPKEIMEAPERVGCAVTVLLCPEKTTQYSHIWFFVGEIEENKKGNAVWLIVETVSKNITSLHFKKAWRILANYKTRGTNEVAEKATAVDSQIPKTIRLGRRASRNIWASFVRPRNA